MLNLDKLTEGLEMARDNSSKIVDIELEKLAALVMIANELRLIRESLERRE